MILPEDIRRFAQSDDGNMGTVGDRTITTARFSMECCGEGYALVDISGRNSGGSSGRADLLLRVDHRLGPAYDFTWHTWRDFGNGLSSDKSNIKRVFEDWEMRSWMFLRDPNTGILDHCVFEWSNPNNQEWAIEAAFTDIKNLR